ncbi:MAG TPA: hypothetical protein VGJ91_19980 [Polyangiaceae bacterium]|jgi:hypothetical protein
MTNQSTLWPERAPTPAGLPTRAITLWQPWAWLVANGHKDLENRPTGFSFKSFRGEFWIHAGLQHDINPAARALAHTMGITIPTLTGPDHFGAIIGRAEIVGIIPPCFGECLHPWHFPAQWGFKVRNARPVTPVRCRGFQGFWGVPPEVLAELAANEAANG